MTLGIRSSLALTAGGLLAVSALVLSGGLRAAEPVQRGQIAGLPDAGDFEVLQLRSNFYMIAGAGANIGVQVGADGVVVVDAGSASKAGVVLAAIKRITSRPIRYVIDTNADSDHVGGNEAIAKAGQTLFLQGGGPGIPADFLGGGASILAFQKVLTRMSGPTGTVSPFPVAALPTEAFQQPRKYMYLNSEGIEVLHQPAAHTDGDAIVFFRRSDVILAGDVMDTTRFPVIDVGKGGTIQGEIAALNRLVDMAIPSVPIVSREEGTLVIPGHGRVCDQLDVVEYRDMVTIIRDRIRDLIKAGSTLEQIKATSPTRGYTRRYGSDTGPWTTNNFVEAIYLSLVKDKP